MFEIKLKYQVFLIIDYELNRPRISYWLCK